MGYDNIQRITSKSQHLTQGNLQFDGTLNVGYDLTYTYGQEDGKKFQLDNVSDVNYRTEATPDENQKTRNSHAYEYDANGNLVYVNTGRTKKDGTTDEKARERKLKWDEENRLLASDDDGFVTNYWYDADGERTVKTSGESEQVYVNSGFAGGRTNTARFSLYVSPYLVANQGGRYTKHIYIGGERIVSKIGDFASYGPDPRRIEYAGSETDAVTVDYDVKYSQQLQAIKNNYATFGVPYNGTDNDDYVNGEGFCCDDGSLEAAQAGAVAQANALDGNFQEGDAYENLQFYYHADHLGSTSYITNLDGEVVQHVEYVPFGEVFIEERNNTWNTPYLFNAKEFDEETGLYYYGARYYDPRLSVWMSVDPRSEETPSWSPYRAFFNNPITFTDPNGEWEENSDGNLVANKEDDAKSLAEYLNTSYYISVKMLSEQGFVDKNGTINIVEGSIFQVERTLQESKRPDLGFLGNSIRNYAGSNFSKNMFENYWTGGGDVELTGKRFAGILLDIKTGKIPMTKSGAVILKNSDGSLSKGTKNIADFYNSSEYSLVFGRATVYKNEFDNVVGFYDYYDFDPKSWGTRSFKSEVITRAVRYTSPNSAKPFAIRYGYSNRK